MGKQKAILELKGALFQLLWELDDVGDLQFLKEFISKKAWREESEKSELSEVQQAYVAKAYEEAIREDEWVSDEDAARKTQELINSTIRIHQTKY